MKYTTLIQTLTQTATMVAAASAFAAANSSDNWLDQAVSPVGNPIYFEDPRITTEIRPVFIEHWLPNTFHFHNDGGAGVPLGGDARVYAVQLRYAITDRLGLIATKDGYIEIKPDHTLPNTQGWGDLSLGLKYALVDDRDKQLIVTPGLTLEVPIGSTEINQGKGAGEWNPFVSAEKGFGNFHLMGNLGFRIPNDFSKQTSQVHYSLHADYFVHRYFIPFFEMNGYTILSEGNHKLLDVVDLNTEMYDLINFGSTQAGGRTQLTVGGGVRSKLTKNLDFGGAYEIGVIKPVGIFESRVTIDLIWRFK